MQKILTYVGILALATPALAQEAQPQQPAQQAQPGASAVDTSRHGPWTRPVTKQDKQGVDRLYKAMEDAWKKGDVEAMAENVEFPVIMLTDTSKGEPRHMEATREQWISFMRPFVSMPKDDVKMSHKYTVHFLSDTLAVTIDEHSMSGKMKGKWKSMSVLTQRDGRWKIKEMSEAGWGDLQPTETAADKARTPASTLPVTP